MSAILEFPPIAQPAEVPAPMSIKAAAVAHLSANEPALRALAERYRAVAFDTSTTKGLNVAKAARLDLRENGRFAMQRARDAAKDLLNAAKKDVEAEADRLIAIIQPIEDHVHEQITARETILAQEKAERERLEAERIAKHRAGIETLRAYLKMAAGLPSERIANGIAKLESIELDATAWEEFFADANAAKDETLAALRALHAKTVQAEEIAAAAERQRIEQARIAEEQRIERERIAAERAELERQRAALKAEQEAAAQAAREAVAQVIQAPEPEGVAGIAHGPEMAEETAQRGATEPSPCEPQGSAAGHGAGDDATCASGPAAPDGLAPETERPTLKLGVICERLGFTMTRAFVESTLGIKSRGTDKAAVLWFESDFARICDALCKHVATCSEGIAV